ncbi:MAG: Holliday junction resolvase RuvX [Xanthomonadales bacterium]|nr:Holliday junction resolvase RuvX [Xanthomonadales bacterium]
MPDENIKPSGTIIAFDFGFRRIGVAVGQTLTGSANVLTVVPVASKPDWQAIAGIVDEWKPAALVVGLPLAEDGGETGMSEAARRFGRQLKGRFGIPVLFEDERLTSFSAEQRFVNARARSGMRKKDAALKDAIAAQIILESWLQT